MKANLSLLLLISNLIAKENLEDGALIRSGTQLQEAHNDRQIEGTNKTMLIK